MPELPEVRTSSRLINDDINGSKIIDVQINVEKMIKEISISNFKKSIIGKKILKVDNLAKFIVFHLSENIVILSHMRMEGKYRFEKHNNLNKHDHLVFELSKGFLIYTDTRKFGTFHIRNEENYKLINPIKKLGPEPSEELVEQIFPIFNRKSIPIKSALLDQTIVSGIGNIYVDEVLWKSKVHPLTKSKDIQKEKIKEILNNAKLIMDQSTKENGSSIKTYLAYNKIKGNYQNYLEVHTKEKHKCSRCKSLIQKIKVQGRGTYICPGCQNY